MILEDTTKNPVGVGTPANSEFCDRLRSNKSYKFEFSDSPSSPTDIDTFEIGSLLSIFIATVLFTACLEYCKKPSNDPWASSLNFSNSFPTLEPVLEPKTNHAALQLKIP